MKKKAILLVLLLALELSLFAAENEEVKKDKWNIYLGTGVYVSQIGVSRDIKDMEVGLNFNSGFPNIFIYSLFNMEDVEGKTKGEQALEYLKESLTLAYAGDIYFKYDVVKKDNIDFDLSVGIAGLYTADFIGSEIMAGFIEAGTRFSYNFKNGHGIYAEVNVPIYAILRTTDSEGASTVEHALLFGNDLATLASITGLCCTRIGYRFSF